MSNFIIKANELLAGDHLSALLSFMKAFLGDQSPELLNSILVVEGNLTNTRHSYNKEMISREEYRREMANMRSAIAYFLTTIETEIPFDDAETVALLAHFTPDTEGRRKTVMPIYFFAASLFLAVTGLGVWAYLSTKKPFQNNDSTALTTAMDKPRPERTEQKPITDTSFVLKPSKPIPFQKSITKIDKNTAFIPIQDSINPIKEKDFSTKTDINLNPLKVIIDVEKPKKINPSKEIVLIINVDSKNANDLILVDDKAVPLLAGSVISIKKILIEANAPHKIQIGDCIHHLYFTDKEDTVTINACH